jgi:hypothetical protein
MKRSIPYAILLFVFLTPFWVYAQSQYADIAQTRTPNVMIIFDTSTSMADKPDGTTANASWVWVDSGGNKVAGPGPGNNQYYFWSGGNHPDSKLYQAKLALQKVITDVVQDKVNLGLSTYGQVKQPNWYGQYTKDVTVTQIKKVYYLYYQTTNSYTSYTLCSSEPNCATKFVDPFGPTTQTGVSVGYPFNRNNVWVYNNGLSFPPPPWPLPPTGNTTFMQQINLKHTVTAITYDAEHNRYAFSYVSDPFMWYTEGTEYIGGTNSCVDAGKTDEKNHPFPDHYNYSGPWKWYSYFNGASGAEKTEYDTPSGGRALHYWDCKDNSSFTPGSKTWIAFNNKTFCDTPNYLGDLTWAYIPGTCYDISDYSYPDYLYGGIGLPNQASTNRPHAWSYFKKDASNNWKENQQNNPYYPSIDGVGSVNNTPGTQDNRYFFVNFPDDKAGSFNQSVRQAARDQILSLLDLTPVSNPSNPVAKWTKLPIHAAATNPTTGLPRTGLTENTRTSYFTPLADSLYYANKYFSSYISSTNDVASSEDIGNGKLCRGNFVILLTDGLESARCTGGTPCPSNGTGAPDYNAAANEAANLLASHVKTYVIGFGSAVAGPTAINALNGIAAAGGTANAYFADNLSTLETQLQTIFGGIIGDAFSRSSPVITKGRDKVYRSYFTVSSDLSNWQGHIEARNIDPVTGNILNPSPAAPNWDAGLLMQGAGTRGTVYTWTGTGANPTRKVFDPNDNSLYLVVYPNPRNEDINGDTFFDDNDAKTIVNYTLNPGYSAGNYRGKRPADWKLGDIYHSTPVLVGAPPSFYVENDYATFFANYQNRQPMLYVGANEGMLHGIKTGDGSELFAVIPGNLIGKVRKLKATHDFYVDSSPKVADVFFSGASGQDWQKWKTVLVTGERGGGPYYFAIDVTDPSDGNYPKILWEWTDPDMGDSWGKPEIGRVNIGGQTKFVAFITGGFSTSNNNGNSFYVVDVETGTTLRSWRYTDGTQLGGATNKVPSGVTAYDPLMDGHIKYVYFGDTEGTLWKVDLSDSNKDNWTCNPLFTPPAAQRKPIFYPPVVAKNKEGKILVFFGTGDEYNLRTVDTDYLWEIWDNNGTGQIVDGSSWPMTLSNEKVLASPVIANNVVYFTSWVNTAGGTQACSTGYGKLYGLTISTVGTIGGVAGLITLDGNGNANPAAVSKDLGPGIPPKIIVTNGVIYISSSINARDITAHKFKGWETMRVRSWREVY